MKNSAQVQHTMRLKTSCSSTEHGHIRVNYGPSAGADQQGCTRVLATAVVYIAPASIYQDDIVNDWVFAACKVCVGCVCCLSCKRCCCCHTQSSITASKATSTCNTMNCAYCTAPPQCDCAHSSATKFMSSCSPEKNHVVPTALPQCD